MASRVGKVSRSSAGVKSVDMADALLKVRSRSMLRSAPEVGAHFSGGSSQSRIAFRVRFAGGSTLSISLYRNAASSKGMYKLAVILTGFLNHLVVGRLTVLLKGRVDC